MERYKIAAIIPTYNRKSLLKECLQAILQQTYKPQIVYICDNKSTDGTKTLLEEFGFLNQAKEGVFFQYLEMPLNGGGAMGFSIGMETAFKKGEYDAFWMMDDDGLPKPDCLEHLVNYLPDYNYISPIVYSRKNHNELVSPINGSTNPNQINVVYGKGEIIHGYCNPFNGSLFSRKLVEIVGFPKKELFIYGDEMNYHQRCIMAGFYPIAVTNAIHYHPPFDLTGYSRFGVVNFKPIKVSMYCQWRNNVYNKKLRISNKPIETIAKIINYFVMHNIFFVFKKPSISWLIIFYRAFSAGLFNKWGGQYKYLK